MSQSIQKPSRTTPFDLFGIPPNLYIRGEEKTQTFGGFICTIMMILAIIAAAVYFAIQFLANTDQTTSSTIVSSKITPTFDLYQNNFLVVVEFKTYGVYSYEYEQVKKNILKLKSFMVNQPKKTNNMMQNPTVSRTELNMVPCDKIRAVHNIGALLNETQICLDFEKKTEIGVSSVDGSLNYLEVRIEPCDVVLYSFSCVPNNPLAADKVTDSPSSNLQVANTILSDLTIVFSFIEAGVEVKNYEYPILYNLNSDSQIKGNLYQEKSFDFYLGELKVETSTGWFQKKESSALRVVSQYTDSIWREPSVKTFEYFMVNGALSSTQEYKPYARIRFLASGEVMIVERKYQTVLDCFSSIGGVAQSIAFVCVLIMAFHHQILLEKSLINEGILQYEDKNKEVASKVIEKVFENAESFGFEKKDVIRHKDLIAQGEGSNVFTYFEIMRFKYFCCKKQTKRYKDYETYCDSIKNRLDVRSLIAANGNINALSQVMLHPYQLKLISVIQKKQEEKLEKTQKLTIEKALEKLYYGQKNKEGDDLYLIRKKMDEYILAQIDEDDQKGKDSKNKEDVFWDDEPQALPVSRKQTIMSHRF